MHVCAISWGSMVYWRDIHFFKISNAYVTCLKIMDWRICSLCDAGDINLAKTKECG